MITSPGLCVCTLPYLLVPTCKSSPSNWEWLEASVSSTAWYIVSLQTSKIWQWGGTGSWTKDSGSPMPNKNIDFRTHFQATAYNKVKWYKVCCKDVKSSWLQQQCLERYALPSWAICCRKWSQWRRHKRKGPGLQCGEPDRWCTLGMPSWSSAHIQAAVRRLTKKGEFKDQSQNSNIHYAEPNNNFQLQMFYELYAPWKQ